MDVKLLAHTQLSEEFVEYLINNMGFGANFTDGQALALSAIRTCYSSNKPSEVIPKEGAKYYGNEASDGKGGSDADRLIRHIMGSGHTSTIEHLNFTFAIEGVSRSLLAQITRHRFFSFSVQSQRYVKFGSENKSGGFDYIVPPNADIESYHEMMKEIQKMYDYLREQGIPAEDARMILPNSATCNIVATTNLRSLLDFYSKRSSKQAQWEIRELSKKMKEKVVKVEPWTTPFFGGKDEN